MSVLQKDLWLLERNISWRHKILSVKKTVMSLRGARRRSNLIRFLKLVRNDNLWDCFAEFTLSAIEGFAMTSSE